MTAITKTSAKSYFQTGLYPTQSQFGDMIDSYLGLAETSAQAIATLNVTTKLSALAANITTVSATSVVTATVSAATIAAATITTTTQVASDNSTNAATTAYVQSNKGFKVGSFTRDISTASGSQAVTGVGFQPKATLFWGGVTNSTLVSLIGASDGVNSGVIADSGSLTPGNYQVVPTVPIYIIMSAAATYSGNIASFDSDGFTITWTKVGSTTGSATINYLALR